MPAEDFLDQVGFDPEQQVLTRRQAEVLALRHKGLSQNEIADRLGTSRANISSIESSARSNVRQARNTVAFADRLEAPVQVTIEPGTELYTVPELIYEACDEAGVKVDHSASEVMRLLSDATQGAVTGRTVRTELQITVSNDGEIHIEEGQ